METVTLGVDYANPAHVDMKTEGMSESACESLTQELARSLGGSNINVTDREDPSRAMHRSQNS